MIAGPGMPSDESSRPEGSNEPTVPRVELAPGYTISRIVRGGWQLASDHGRGAPDPDAAVEAMRRFVEAGITTFDCADIYTGVEELIGRFLREYRHRDRIQTHTKFVPDRDVLPRISRDYVERIVDRSLRRLGVERLDLVQFAWWDYGVPGYLETAGWLQELREEGKIRHLGATNFDVPRLRELVEAGIDLVAHQVQYSLLDRRPERDGEGGGADSGRGTAGAGQNMVDFCREQGIGLLCYGTLAGGFLTSRWLGAEEPTGPLGSLENRSLTKYRLIIEEFGGWDLYQELLTALDALATGLGGDRDRPPEIDLATVALRWVLDRPGVAGAIVGARTSRHLESTLGAFGMNFERGEEWGGVRIEDKVSTRPQEPVTGTGPEGNGQRARPADGSSAEVREALDRLTDVLDRARGPAGPVYGLERDPDGPHASIMKYNLNRGDWSPGAGSAH